MVIKVSSLEKVCKIKKETNTEVWLKFFKSQKDFYIHNFKVANENKHKFLKTSLDYQEDYKFIKRIFDELHKLEYIFKNKDIIDLVKKDPNILKINSDKQHLQRWYNHIAKSSN